MIYTDNEKKIYTSPLNTLHDPLQVCNGLILQSQGQWNGWLKAYYSPESDVERAAASLQLATVGRQVFGLKPLTADGGYGDASVLEVVDHFMEYVGKKA
jgi:hypothetical protein